MAQKPKNVLVLAEKLKVLLAETKTTPAEVQRRTALDGFPSPVSSVTVWRILNAEARRAPERQTLERIANALGQPYEYFTGPVANEGPDGRLQVVKVEVLHPENVGLHSLEDLSPLTIEAIMKTAPRSKVIAHGTKGMTFDKRLEKIFRSLLIINNRDPERLESIVDQLYAVQGETQKKKPKAKAAK